MRLANLVFLSAFFCNLLFAQNAQQIVSGELDSSELFDSETSSLTVKYQATDNALTTGLGLRLHFDSSQITIGSYSERLNAGAQPFQIVPDDQDYDNDASTDQYYLTSWADFAGVGWPVDGNTGNPLGQPVDLYSVPIITTSEFSGTTLRFTASSVASGYSFIANDISIGKRSGSLDIDGNKSFDALTDGLLVLRSMFGLSGDTLILGTVASDALYKTASEIQARIDEMGNTLDIDNNSNKDALTDGLIILRYLFGLRGDVLISGVVASDAKRTSSTEIQSYLESLMSLNTAGPEITSSLEYSVDENQIEIGTVTATDPDGDQLSFSVGGQDGNKISIDSNTGSMNFIDAPNFEVKSSYSFEITVSDGEFEVTQTMTININDVNDAPSFLDEWRDENYELISGPNFTIAENHYAPQNFGKFSPYDEDGDQMTFSISGDELYVSGYDKLYFYNSPDYEEKNFYTATLTLSDGELSTSQEITVTVTDIDDAAPMFTSSATFSVAENQTSIGVVTATDPDTDDSLIVYSVSGSELSINSSSGVLTFNSAPDYETKSSYSATVTASDGTNTSMQDIQVMITDVDETENRAPTFTSNATFSAAENQTAIGTVTATDADGDTLSYSLSGTDTSAISINSTSGMLVFNTAPDYEIKTSYSVIVTVSDGSESASQTLNITILDVDDVAPVFTSDATFSAAENQTSIGTVTATDTDTDDSLIVFSVSGSELLITSGGILTFANAPDYETKTSYSATVTASDGTNSATQDITVNITDANDSAPVFTSSAAFSAVENQTAIGTITTTDPDNDAVTYSLSGTDASSMSINSSSGVLTFNSAPDYETKSSYSATVTASDGTNSTSQTITVTIVDVDDVAPAFTSNATFSVAENRASIGTVTATDTDTDDSSITFSVSGSELSIGSSTGVLAFNSAPDYETKSSYSATVTASDGTNSSTQDITVTITDIDDVAPVFTSNATFSAAENQTSIGTVTATDTDTDDSSIVFSVSGSELAITSGGVLTFASAPDYETKSSYSATVTASDGTNSSTQDITVTITDVDDVAPVFTSNATFSAAENQTAIGTVTATDADTDDSSIVFSVSGSELAITSGGVLTFASAPDYETKSSYSATVTASDGTNSSTQDITVNVTNVNEKPVITSASSFSVDENQTDIGRVIAIDVDGDAITYSVLKEADHESVDIDSENGILVFRSAPNYETSSSYTVSVSVSDGEFEEKQVIQITINDVNDAPYFTDWRNSNYELIPNPEFVVSESINPGDYIGAFSPRDEDGDDFTFSISGDDLKIAGYDKIYFVSSPDFETKSFFEAILSISDGELSTDVPITVTLTDVDDTAPVFTSSTTFSVAENQTSIGVVTATDPDTDDSLIVYSVSGSELSINSSSGVLTFNSAPDYETKLSYSATVTASDGTNSATQNITVNVTNVNDNTPSITSNATFSAAENQTSIGTVIATDADGDTLSFSLSGTDASSMSINSSSGVLTFNSAPDYETKLSYSATVISSDGANSSTQDITVTITDIDDVAPVFTSSATFSAAENQTSIGAVTATDADTDDSLIVFSVSGSELLITSGGILTFANAPDYETKTSYSATVTASDGTNSATQDITVNITDANDSAPEFTSSATFSATENQTSIGTVTATDGDGDTIGFSLSGTDASSMSINSSSGVLMFNSAPDYETKSSYSATVTASDGTNSTSQTITVTIVDVDDVAPAFTSNATFSAAENQTSIGTVTATDTDTDDSSIVFSVSGSELAITPGGVLTFASAPDYETKSSYSATVTASDGTNSSTQDITVTITDVDDVAPVFTSNATFSAAENQTSIGTVTATDADTDDSSIVFSVSGSELAITSGGVLTFASAPDYETKSSYSATVTASDGTNSSTQDITVNVTDVNDNTPSITSSATFSAAENQTSIGTVTATDADGDTLSYSTLGPPGSNTNNAFPQNDHPSLDETDYYVVSPTSGQSISLKVFNIDDSMVVSLKNSSGQLQHQVTQGRSGSTTINVRDYLSADGSTIDLELTNPSDGFTFSWELSIADQVVYSNSCGQNGVVGCANNSYTSGVVYQATIYLGPDSTGISINSETGLLTFDSAPDYETKSSYSATVTASDGANSATQDITVNVTNLNDNSPSFTSSATFSAAENQTSIGTVTATDADDDTVSYSLSGTDASSMSINSSSGVLTFNSAPDYETKTSYSATVTASDGTNSATQDITVNITDANDSAPVFTSSATFSAAENQTSIGTITTTDPDNDTVTYSLSGTDASSMSINSSSGVLTFNSAPDYESKTSYTATVTASDGTNSTSQTITVTIVDVDDVAPAFTSNTTFSAAENQTSIGTVTATDTDTDDSLIVFSVSGSELAITSGGVLTFASAPDYETKSSYSATVTASDGTNSSTQDITVTIADADDVAPAFTSNAIFSAAENQTAIGTVTATDTDTDDSSIVFSVSGSELAITSGGVLTFASAPDYETKSSYSATVTASDGTNSSTQDITVNVTNVNEKPVITSASSFSVDENQTDIGTITAQDDSDNLTFELSGTDSSSMVVNNVTGQISFTESPDYETKSTYSAIARVYDEEFFVQKAFQVFINNLNDNTPSITSSATFSAAENQTTIGTVTATDADGDTVSYSLSGTDASSISINSSSGALTFNGAPDYETKTSYSARVTASDGTNSATQDITVNVTNVNDNSPSITSSASFSAAENQTSIGTVTSIDADGDGDTISYSLSGTDASSININSSSGVLTFNSAPDYETKSSYSVIVTVSDGTNSSTQTITINITNVNDNSPTITSGSSFSISEGQTAIGTVTSMDVDGDTVSYSLSGTDASSMSINSSSGVLAFDIAPDYETKSSYSATVTASDGMNSSTQDITITINDVDDTAPTFTSGATFSGDENQTSIGTVTATDTDTDDSSIIFSVSGSELAITSGGVLTFNSAPDYETKTSYTATVTASDGTNSSTQNITVNVTNVNDNTPSITSSATFSAAENQISIGTVTATDEDGDTIGFSLSGTDASSMSINSSSGVLTFNSAPDYETKTSYTVTVTASDGTNSVTQDITVNVTNVNDNTPSITSGTTFSAAENQTAIGTVTATDADSDTIGFSLSGTDASSISINSSSGVLTFNSEPDYETKSSYSATVTASDGTNSTSQTITVTIVDVDDVAPAFTSNATFSAAENQTSIGTVTATDTDTADSSIVFSVSGSELAITSGGVLTFASAPDYETKSSYSATVTASDGTNSSTQDISVTITDVDDVAPVFTSNATFSAAENQTSIGTVTATDTDTDDSSIVFSVSGSELAITSGGVLTFASAPDYETKSSYSATVTATDGTNSSTQDITVNVTNVNDNTPSITSSATFSVAENQTSIGTVTATDADGDTLSYSILSAPLSAPGSNTNNAFPQNDHPSLDETDYYVVSPASDQSVSLRVFNIDRIMTVSLKNASGGLEQQITVQQGSSATISVSDYLSADGSTIDLELTNPSDGFTFSWELSIADQVVHSNSCGVSGRSGCADNSFTSGVVYQATIYLGPASMSINSSSGVLTFNSAPDYETKTSYTATVTASDGTNSATQDITVNVTNLNDNSPSFTSSATFSAAENQTAIGTVSATDADGDTVSYSLSGTDASSMSINSSSGVLTFNSAPDYETKTSYSAIVTASDGTNSTTQNITVNLTNLNDNTPSITSSATFNAAENQTAIGTVTATDVDGDTLSYSLSGTDASSMSINSSSGVLIFNSAPDYETKSSYSATVTASDGTNSITQNITVNITDVNESPIFTSGATFSAAENQTAIGTVTATDADGDTLSYSLSGTDASSMSINSSSGVLTFNSAPDYETKTSYTATVTASDGTNSATQDITVNVTNLNDNSPSITSSATFSAAENQTAIGTVSATDADGDTLSYSLSGTDASSMSINSSSGVLTFNSAPDYETKTSYTATVTVSDGTNSITQNITVNITDVNESPIFTSSATFSAAENQTAIGTVTATDVDGDTLSYSLSGTDASSMSINSSSGVLTFNSAPDYETKSSYSATVTASDGTNSITQNITVNITDVNESPIFTSGATFSAAENQTAIGTVTATDADGDTLSYSLSGTDASSMSINSSSGVLTFNSAPDYETKTSYTATVTASDGTNSATQDITVNVTNLNDNSPSITSSATFSAAENQTAIGTVTATDADGDTISYSIRSALGSNTNNAFPQNDHPSLDETDYYVVSPASDQSVSLRVFNIDRIMTVSLKNASGGLEQQITVQQGSSATISVSDYLSADGSTIDLELTNPSDGFTFSWELSIADQVVHSNSCGVSGRSGCADNSFTSGVVYQATIYLGPTYSDISINSTTGVITFDSAPDYETKSSYSATVTASDGTNSATQDITINVTNLNDNSPSFTSSATFSAAENQTAIGTVTATDADGDTISYSLSGTDASSMSINSSSGVLTFNSAPDYETKSSYSATVTANDGTNSSTQNITVNLTNLNDNTPSITSSATFSAAENQTAIGTVTATDADGDTLSYSLSGTDASSMSINSSSGVLIFNSAPDYETKTSYTATVTVTDGTNSVTQNITVSITNIVNDEAPVFTSGATFSVAENQTAIGTVTATDVDTDDSSITFSVSGSELSITSGGILRFINAPDYETKTTYTATVTASDGTNTTNQNITVNVTNVNDNAPIFTSSGSFSVNENQTNIGSVAVNDADGDTLSYSLSGTDASSMSINSSSGALTFNSAPDYETKTSYSATVTASDGTNSTSQNITITIANVNDNTPSITSGATFSADENQTAIGTATATDADGDTISYSLSGTDASSMSINSSSGVLTFNSAPDYETKTSYTARVTASDGTNSATQDITVNVTNLNDNSPSFTSSATFSAAENQTAIGTVTATDADGDTISYSLSGTDASSMSINSSSGVLTFNSAPDYETKSSYSATVTANDGTNSSTQNITVNLTNLNDNTPSITSSATFSAAENQTAIGTVTATDADGDTLSYSLSGTDASSMSVNSSSGVLIFNSAPDYETKTSYTATVTVTDGTNSVTQNITVSIMNVVNDEAPVFTSGATFSAAENQTSIGTVTATDVDTDNSSITFSVSGSELSIGSSTGVLAFNSAPDYETKTTYTATVTASDGTNATNQNITVNVTNVNDNTPSITSSSTFSAAENQTAIGTVTATDADGDTISYSLSGTDASSMSINSSNGIMSFNSAPDYETKSSYSATVTASDGTNSTSQAVTVTIVDVDDVAPAFTSSATFSAAENQTSIGTVTATDVDTDDSSITFSVSGSELSITSGGVMTFVNAPDYETKSSYSATVTASDGTNSSTQNITVNITNIVNDEAPVFTSSATFSAAENQTSIGTVTATDVDTDDSSITFSVSGSELSIGSSSGVLTFNSAPDYETKSSYSATVTASDGANTTNQNIIVNVTDVNDNSPSITSSASFSVAENQTAIGTVTATDADGDTLSYSLSGTDASSMSINSSSGVLTFNSAPDYETKTSYTATVTVSDGTNSVSQNITVSITNIVNDEAPIFTSGAIFSAAENQTSIGTVTATDSDSTSISFSVCCNAPGTNTNNAFIQDNHASLDETDYYVVSPTSGQSISLRVYDIDDYMTVSLKNSTGVLQYQTDVGYTETIDIRDYLSADGSTIEMELYNNGAGYTMGWELSVAGQVVFSNSCGIYNRSGCAANVGTTGKVYKATIYLGLDSNMTIDSTSGLLSFISAPDYETKSQYQGTVTASDGSNSTTQDITVNVTDVQE